MFLVLLAVGLIVVFFVAWVFPAWFTGHDKSGLNVPNNVEILKQRNAVRTTLLQGIAGVFLLASAVVAWRQMMEGARQAREAQQTTADQLSLAKSSTRRDQMSRAITALGDESVAVRVGGVFSLEQAMDELDSDARRPRADLLTERSFRENGIYTLASFVRTHAPKDPRNARPRAELDPDINPEPRFEEDIDLRVRAPDVQAAALVIGRRPQFSDADYERIAGLQHMDEDDPRFDVDLKSWLKRVEVSLHNAYLNNAALSDLNLTLVRFDDAVLTYASLRRADLRCSRLVRADLRRAFLRSADLRWTNLEEADLTRARLVDADFGGAKLNRATFTNATIRGAKFEHAVGVDSVRSWDGAKADENTTWPSGRMPQGVVIKEVAEPQQGSR